MINLHESMGPGRDRTRDPWICSQTRICCQTHYRLCYGARYLKENTTLCIKGKFSCFCCRLLTFSKINFQKIISEHYQSVKLFGSRSGPRKSCPGLGQNCSIGYLSRLQKSQLALIMKKLQILFIKPEPSPRI